MTPAYFQRPFTEGANSVCCSLQLVPGTISFWNLSRYSGQMWRLLLQSEVESYLHLRQDFAYPSIAFAGETDRENSMMMTFSHVGEDDFPGTSAVFYNFKDGLYDNYSPVVMIKEGDSVINSFLADLYRTVGRLHGYSTAV